MAPRAASPNPWLQAQQADTAAEPGSSAAAVVETPELDGVLGEATMLLGPPAPLHGRTPSEHLGVLPAGTTLTVAGLHGGAGTTTLQQQIGLGAIDHGTPWQPGDSTIDGLVVAVARLHGLGLARALDLATAWSHGQLGDQTRLLGLVLVDDGPKPTKPQLREAKLIAGSLPRTWRIPWVASWRSCVPTELVGPGAPTAPRRVRTTTKSIRGAYRSAVHQPKES